MLEVHEAVREAVRRINARFGGPGYEPVHCLERHVPLHERIAFYSIAHVAVVTATRDGMNLARCVFAACRWVAAARVPRGPLLAPSRSLARLRPRSANSHHRRRPLLIHTPLHPHTHHTRVRPYRCRTSTSPAARAPPTTSCRRAARCWWCRVRSWFWGGDLGGREGRGRGLGQGLVVRALGWALGGGAPAAFVYSLGFAP